MELGDEQPEEPRRVSGNYQRELVDIFVIALTSVTCGYEGGRDRGLWAQ